MLDEAKKLITLLSNVAAACMTWDLAESGKHFITTIINGSDLVPTFSAASVDDLRTEIVGHSLGGGTAALLTYILREHKEFAASTTCFTFAPVTASSWLNDLRDQVERTKVLNVVYRSATALGSRLPSMATAKASVAGAGALLRPVSSSTKVVMKGAQNVAQAVVRSRSSLTSWSCIGPRRRNVVSGSNAKGDDMTEPSLKSKTSSKALVTEVVTTKQMQTVGGLDHNDTDEDEPLIEMDRGITTSTTDEFVGGELWYELEKELKRQESEVDLHGRAEEAAAAKEISEQENVIAADVSSETRSAISSSDASENLRFYPPGRIMHIVAIPSSDAAVLDDHDGDGNGDGSNNGKVRIYETPRELYSKIRLSRTMINDHYMPMYKKMMELLIIELEKEEDCNFDVLQG
ncbi:hypothetical protein GOBAR_AA38823 [Gossypium barbadense]|uniref:Fungal lipase-type domain-containing protein n=1 Tax=Gossypium barbadense TaxID=3634 RepID=A0A2P5VSS8_GOSBA|nr:hypothetical protein GOBAR_AA38823 [Gossypium barbadense]